MMHLTAINAAPAIRRRPASPLAIGRNGCKHQRETIAAYHYPIRRKSIFLSPVANCLEMRRAAFHYSVTVRHATDSLTLEYVARRSLNDEVSASDLEVATLGAYAQGVDECRFNPDQPVAVSNRWKKD